MDRCTRAMLQPAFFVVLCLIFCNFGDVLAVEGPVRRISQINATDTPFNTITEAYNDPATIDSDAIQCHSGLFQENLLFNKPLTVSLTGGFDVGYANNPGLTTAISLVILDGTITADQIVLAPLLFDVTIVDFAFSPLSITVNVGDTVRWTNTGTFAHTSTSGAVWPTWDGIWDSGPLFNGQSFSFTFTQPGTFPYFCLPHGFSGTVIVQ